MKRNSFLLTFAALMVFSFGLAYGQPGVAHVDAVITSGLYAGDTVAMNATVSWELQYTNNTGAKIAGATNGFQVWTTSGANFDPITYDTLPNAWGVGWKAGFDLVVGINSFSVDGLGRDTVGFGGAALAGPGIPNGTNNSPSAWIATVPRLDGDTLCIDTSFYPPGGAWLWSPQGLPAIQPSHNLPLCYTVYLVPNQPPVFDNCVAALSHDHCVVATYDYDAHDQDTIGGLTIFTQLAGPGSTAANGVWSYAPSLADVGVDKDVVIEVCDGAGACDTCTTTMSFTNVGVGSFTDGCGDSLNVGMGNSITHDIDAVSADCDPITYLICGVLPA
ncbi:MAG: hypothetical protein AB1744_14800, partial [Candidatus Zixiibacteriota bacterium]